MSYNECSTFNYNGHSFSFDIADADEAEKYEAAVKKMGQTEKLLPKDGSLSVIYRAQCKYLKTFFDDVLGAGAGAKICGEKDNIEACYQAYVDFLKFIAAQRDNILDTRNALQDISPKKVVPAQTIPHSSQSTKSHKKKHRH